jgi:hypothetical protein
METTTSIDDNFLFSIGTETPDNLSVNQAGGFWPFSSSNKEAELITSMALDAFNERRIKEGSYLLANAAKRGVKPDLSKKDDAGRNLLHLLVLYSAYDPEVKETLLHQLDRSDTSKYINAQDKQLNTVAHYALSLKQIDVLKLLVSKGVDLSLRNSQDFYIKLAKMPIESQDVMMESQEVIRSAPVVRSVAESMDDTDGHKNIFVKCSNKAPVLRNIGSLQSENLNRELDNIVNMFLKKDVGTIESIDFDMQDMTETARRPSQKTDDVDSINFLSELMRQFRDTRRPLQPLTGGAKAKPVQAVGRRRMNTYSEISIGGGSTTSVSDSESDSDTDGVSKIARSIKNKTTELHEETIKKIMEIMKVPEDVARNYKAALYQRVKSEQPDLSGHDRANEMLKLATKDVLKKIDIDKVTSDIKAHLAQNSSAQKLSSTSSESSESESTSSEKPKRKTKRMTDTLTSDSGLITMSSFEY